MCKNECILLKKMLFSSKNKTKFYKIFVLKSRKYLWDYLFGLTRINIEPIYFHSQWKIIIYVILCCKNVVSWYF